MAPQPFSRRFPRDNQVTYPIYPQSWEDKIETSDPPSRKNYTASHANKTINTLQQLEGD